MNKLYITDRLKNSPMIDYAMAVSFCSSEDMIIGVFDNSRINLKKSLRDLTEAFDRINSDGLSDNELTEKVTVYRIAAHSIKGSGKLTGIQRLADAGLASEMAAREGNLQKIRDNHQILVCAVNDTVDLLNDIFALETNAVGEMDVEAVLEQLNILQGALEDLELDTMDAVGDALKELNFTSDLAGVRDELVEAIANIDEDAIVELIDILKKKISG